MRSHLGCCVAVGMVAAQLGLLSERPALAQSSGAAHTLRWADNPKLPKFFRQFDVPRNDGSAMRAFVTADAPDSAAPRPLLIYIDGSGAQSQFTLLDDGRVSVGLLGLAYKQAGDRFAVAGCDKRGVEFGKGGRSAGSGEGASPEYTQSATYDGRVSEVRLLIDALAAQPWIDASKIVLVGHSEGADVAAGVAAADPRVTHVAFLAGGGPTQMFDLMVLRRKAMAAGGATAEQIEQSIAELEEDYRRVFAAPDSADDLFMGHAYRRWSSFFAHPPVDNLLRSRAKLFLMHGSQDQSVPIESFDLLVADLIRAGRKDVEVRRCANCDHSLSDIGGSGAQAALEQVFADIAAWASS